MTDDAATDTPHVMVVDDDPAMCDFLRTFLSDRGYEAIAFANPEEAISHYQSERPAAVILDMSFPGSMDGLEALAAFKKIDREVPVIVLSGHGLTTTAVSRSKAVATRWSKAAWRPDRSFRTTAGSAASTGTWRS